MKIILISTSTYPSDQGLRTISSCLKKEEHNIKMVFMPMEENYSLKYPLKALIQLKQICKGGDLIGISAYASTSPRAIQIIDYLKSMEIPFVWGGPHATISPNKCIQHVNIICRGEGEEAIVELATKLDKKKDYSNIQNLWIKKEGKIIKNDVRCLQPTLDHLPPPDYDLQDHYILENEQLVHFKERHLNGYIFFMTSRGCPNACTYCFPAGNLVESENGMIPIEDIKLNEKVLCADGKWHKVNNLYKRKYSGRLVKLLVTKLGEGITCTSDHKILTYRNKKTCYIKAEEIKKSDKLCVPLPPEEKEEIDLYKFLYDVRFKVKLKRLVNLRALKECIKLHKDGLSTRKISTKTGVSKSYVHYIIKASNNKERWVSLEKKEVKCKIHKKGDLVRFTFGRNPVKRKIKLNGHLCRLFGYYLAEGSLLKDKSRPNSFEINFSFGKTEKAYIDDTISIINKEFRIEPSLVKDKTATRVVISNSIIGHLFERLFDKGSRNKRIHPIILNLAQKELKQLLCGYIRGDGDKNLICSTVSKSLAYQIQLIGFKCGYSPGVYRCKGGRVSIIDGRILKCNGYYAMSFKNTQKENELKKIVYGIKQNKKQVAEKYIKHKNFILLPVKEIKTFASNKEVFNIEVSSQHNYTINNIVVKNCSNHLYRQLHSGKGKLIRSYSPDYTIKELKRLKNKFPSIGVFDIRDETFLARPLEDIKKFAAKYKKEVGIRFKCLVDPPTTNKDKLKLLVDARVI